MVSHFHTFQETFHQMLPLFGIFTKISGIFFQPNFTEKLNIYVYVTITRWVMYHSAFKIIIKIETWYDKHVFEEYILLKCIQVDTLESTCYILIVKKGWHSNSSLRSIMLPNRAFPPHPIAHLPFPDIEWNPLAGTAKTKLLLHYYKFLVQRTSSFGLHYQSTPWPDVQEFLPFLHRIGKQF